MKKLKIGKVWAIRKPQQHNHSHNREPSQNYEGDSQLMFSG